MRPQAAAFFCLFLTENEVVAWTHGSKPVLPERMLSGVQGHSNKPVFMQGKLEWRLRPVSPSLDTPHRN